MIALIQFLENAPWRLIAIVIASGTLFVGGCQFGQDRIHAKWNLEKIQIAKAVSDRQQQVLEIADAQTNINQEISNEMQTQSSTIAANHHLFDRIPGRVHINPTSGSRTVPRISSDTVSITPTATDLVPSSEQINRLNSCEKLAEDSAQTTLMVVEFQRWYREQLSITTDIHN